MALAAEIAALPQRCLRSDRRSSYDQWGLSGDEALANETELGLATIRSRRDARGRRQVRRRRGASRRVTSASVSTHPTGVTGR